MKKLSDNRQGASDKHLRVASMLRVSPQQIDLGWVRTPTGELGLGGLLVRVEEAAR